MAGVTLKNIMKIYDGGVVAVQEFNLEIADKEFVVFVGPSGCGKSTTLRMIAGLEEISQGEIYIGDKLINNVPPKDRDISMVFQNYALYPHMSVYDNMAFALKLRKLPKKEIDVKVKEAAEILKISELLKRKPKALSGGQRQRVAIGRAIVRKPQVFLMDEPLSNLDAKLRNQMRTELIELRRRLDTTFVYVTHDQTEAMTLGDRIVVMRDGFMQQVGTPQEVFDHPRNTFVAGFIGTPQMNFFSGTLIAEAGGYFVQIDGVAEKIRLERPVRRDFPEKVTVGIRPEHIQLSESGAVRAQVGVSELMGSTVHLHVNFAGSSAVVILSTEEFYSGDIPHAQEVNIAFGSKHLHVFDAESGDTVFLSQAPTIPQALPNPELHVEEQIV